MNALNRQEFLKLVQRGLALFGLTVIAAPIVAYFYPTNLQETPLEPVLVGDESDLPMNSAKTVRFGRYPALVVNTVMGLRAYSAVCTHFGCIVKWNPDSGEIACPCHEGYFDPLDGHVISGPPPEPLLPIQVQLVDGQIFIGGEG
jgi:cytochrome b6-f complex iron-sulfur subunit